MKTYLSKIRLFVFKNSVIAVHLLALLLWSASDANVVNSANFWVRTLTQDPEQHTASACGCVNSTVTEDTEQRMYCTVQYIHCISSLQSTWCTLYWVSLYGSTYSRGWNKRFKKRVLTYPQWEVIKEDLKPSHSMLYTVLLLLCTAPTHNKCRIDMDLIYWHCVPEKVLWVVDKNERKSSGERKQFMTC